MRIILEAEDGVSDFTPCTTCTEHNQSKAKDNETSESAIMLSQTTPDDESPFCTAGFSVYWTV